MMKALLFLLALTFTPPACAAEQTPVEVHDVIAPQLSPDKRVALTLDACSGKYDSDLIDFLIKNRIPATLFATRRWLNHNPFGLSVIKSHLDLFEVENHGANHIPAVIGKGKTVYGIAGEPDIAHLRSEVRDGAIAVQAATGTAPRWYRSATGEYDAQAIAEIDRMDYKIAGFSVNADNGATLKRNTIRKRLTQVKGGDVIIAHMNKPASETAEGLADGLTYLLNAGFVFVRLDQVDLQELPHKK